MKPSKPPEQEETRSVSERWRDFWAWVFRALRETPSTEKKKKARQVTSTGQKPAKGTSGTFYDGEFYRKSMGDAHPDNEKGAAPKSASPDPTTGKSSTPGTPKTKTPTTAQPKAEPPEVVYVERPVRVEVLPSDMDRSWTQENSVHFTPHDFRPRWSFGNKNPLITISEQAFDKMMHYVDYANEEVGWLGTVVQLADGSFYIKNVYLFAQDVHGTTTKITTDGLAMFVQEHLDDEDGDEIWECTRFWGHSHVRMQTSPSGQDNRQMEQLRDCGQDYFIRGIFNKLGSAYFSIYFFKEGVEIHDVPWIREDVVDPTLYSQIRAEFDQKVHSTSGRGSRRGRTFGKPQKATPAATKQSASKPMVAPVTPAKVTAPAVVEEAPEPKPKEKATGSADTPTSTTGAKTQAEKKGTESPVDSSTVGTVQPGDSESTTTPITTSQPQPEGEEKKNE